MKDQQKPKPQFPYDPKTEKIVLPEDIEAELKETVLSGNMVPAMKRVMELTGAGLGMSKAYLDKLAGRF